MAFTERESPAVLAILAIGKKKILYVLCSKTSANPPDATKNAADFSNSMSVQTKKHRKEMHGNKVPTAKVSGSGPVCSRVEKTYQSP